MNENLRSIFYISKSCLDQEQASDEIARLVAAARKKNEDLLVTGALVFTGTGFAQLIEGPAHSIESLLHSIAVDPRHREMVVHVDRMVPSRSFDRWALAYSGPSVYISKHMELITSSDGVQKVRQIDRFLRLLGGLTLRSEHVAHG